MALIGQAVSEEKIFENGGRTDGRTDDDGRRLEGYTISSPCEPNGSGELIKGKKKRERKEEETDERKKEQGKKEIRTRIDVYETLCPQQMLVHKGGKIKNWGGECRDVTPTNCSLKI